LSWQEAFRLLDTAGEFQTHLSERISIGRVGETEEVANLACYLVSDYSTYMNGAVRSLHSLWPSSTNAVASLCQLMYWFVFVADREK